MKGLLPWAISAALLGGCVSATGDAEGEPRVGSGKCNEAAAQHFLGRDVSRELGAEMLAASGAKTLRWAPPGAVLTMDFRPDRLTVHYGSAGTIERIACG